MHTLGLLEDALVDTSLQRLVEERIEHVVRDSDVVVGADILLEGLAAGECVSGITLALRQKQSCWVWWARPCVRRCDDAEENATNKRRSYLEPLRSLSWI